MHFLRVRIVLGYCIYSISLFGAAVIDTPVKQEQQRKIFEQIRSIDTTIPSSFEKPDDNRTRPTSEGSCIMTSQIVLHNSTLLSRIDTQVILERYIGKCNGIKSLNTLAKELSNLYMESGYITSRFYIAPQDISDGIIDLYAIEGKIETVGSDNSKTVGAFIGLEGNPLDLTDLETSLEQVNRLRSNTTKMDLLPGKEQGSTIVLLNTTETSPFFGSFGINNYGSDAIGKFQLYGGFIWENFFGFSDILTLNINTTDKQQTGKKSLGNSVTYSIPLGKWLWEGSISRFRYEQTISGLNEDFLSQGISDVITLGTAYKLHHTGNYNLEINTKIAHKNNKSLINGALIESSTYDISIGSIGLKYVYRRPSWEFYLLPDYHHGLNLYSPTIEGELKHDFSKWTLVAGGTKYFQAPLPITYQFSGYAQYSNDLLYSVEQISIGGAYSIRGFQKQTISGSSGWYARNDLLMSISEGFSPYVAYDIGFIRPAEDTIGGRLSSATFGFRSRYRGWDLDVYHAIPLDSPNETFDTRPFIGMTLSANF